VMEKQHKRRAAVEKYKGVLGELVEGEVVEIRELNLPVSLGGDDEMDAWQVRCGWAGGWTGGWVHGHHTHTYTRRPRSACSTSMDGLQVGGWVGEWWTGRTHTRGGRPSVSRRSLSTLLRLPFSL
jgi:hypothetical protein